MTVEVFERSHDQRLAALARANDVRFERARLKKRLRARTVTAAELVADPPAALQSMRLEKLLQSIRGYGPRRVKNVLRMARVSDAKTVGGLSPRQRDEIVELLEKAGV